MNESALLLSLTMIIHALVALFLGSGIALCVHYYRRQRRQVIFAGGLPDPDPLHDFDLVGIISFPKRIGLTKIALITQDNATTRNHLYVNKPVRVPYFQVCTSNFSSLSEVRTLKLAG